MVDGYYHIYVLCAGLQILFHYGLPNGADSGDLPVVLAQYRQVSRYKHQACARKKVISQIAYTG